MYIFCCDPEEFPELVSYKTEIMEFDIFIITQIVYVKITFKWIISSFSSAYIAHISTHTHFKC